MLLFVALFSDSVDAELVVPMEPGPTAVDATPINDAKEVDLSAGDESQSEDSSLVSPPAGMTGNRANEGKGLLLRVFGASVDASPVSDCAPETRSPEVLDFDPGLLLFLALRLPWPLFDDLLPTGFAELPPLSAAWANTVAKGTGWAVLLAGVFAGVTLAEI